MEVSNTRNSSELSLLSPQTRQHRSTNRQPRQSHLSEALPLIASAVAWALHRLETVGPLLFCKWLLTPPKSLQALRSLRTWLRTRWLAFSILLEYFICTRCLTLAWRDVRCNYFCSSPGTSLLYWKQFVSTITIAMAKSWWRTCKALSSRSACASQINNSKSTVVYFTV